MPGEWKCFCHPGFLYPDLHQNPSAVTVPRGQESWRRGLEKTCAALAQALLLGFRAVWQGEENHLLLFKTIDWNPPRTLQENYFISFVSSVSKEKTMSLVIPISFHCLLSPVNNLTASLLCRSFIITLFSNRLEKSNNTKVIALRMFAKNVFSIIRRTESSEEKKLLPSFGL